MTFTQSFRVALLVCGAFLAPIVAQAQQPTTAEAKKAADEAYTRQREYLLHNDWPNLQRYAAANQRLPAPQPGAPRVVLLGNSITEGWPKADTAFFAGKPYGYIGRGISGQTSGQTVLRFRQDVIDLHPAVVVLLIGTNDVAENNGPYNPQTTLGNIMTMVELAQAHRIRVVLSSITPAADFWWRKGLNPAPKIVALNQQLKAYAAKSGCVYLDYHSALADEQQGLRKTYGEDGVHPNLAGYRVMEPLLNQAVAAALKKK
ncbi:GDSL-type esterase/lipase family protein [Hymenobacter sp. BT770]|uniref:GDSL-type esterase/lipase family protein n=1 Tax=Hymenobacter sp. BT770 TaxID=2886942 RepID=UPI001D13048A|nr:GDSL-type esterase/lipase family protein [Hymenobacter sp. BT770]MCC3153171.1 GDSL-type esterase/lipase family protein [Hymenobacter sp. BT770]MDO3415355.1 GDSL-type esterase/lipase family protein [Hymenobacter sp. BT770]